MEMWVIEQVIKYRHFLIPCNRKSFGALRICSSITETAFCPDLWVRTKKKRPMALQRWAPCRGGRWLWAGSSPPQLSPSCWDGSLPGHAHSMGGEWTWGQWHKETTKAVGRCWLPSTIAKSFTLILGYWRRILGAHFAGFILLCLNLLLSIMLFNLDAVTVR